MTQIQLNYNLKQHNTFGIEVFSEAFAKFHSAEKLVDILKNNDHPIFLLGGGSNILFTKNIEGLVLENEILGKEIIEENENSVLLKIGGGENWHDLVLWTLENNYFGLENLSLIPGKVGTAPIQNIGAYGVELKEVFEKLEFIDLQSFTSKTFNPEDCQFGYRDSIFKRNLKGKICITQVYLRLSKIANVNISYGAITQVLNQKNIQNPSPKDVSEAVIEIRQSKLPDPKEIGNAGSFFKNPSISKSEFERLKKAFPNIVFYELPDGKFKIPAGWLIDQDGWRGKLFGNYGVHKNQALVLVNYGGASGKDIWELAQKIQQSVKEKFGISLTPEVNVW